MIRSKRSAQPDLTQLNGVDVLLRDISTDRLSINNGLRRTADCNLAQNRKHGLGSNAARNIYPRCYAIPADRWPDSLGSIKTKVARQPFENLYNQNIYTR